MKAVNAVNFAHAVPCMQVVHEVHSVQTVHYRQCKLFTVYWQCTVCKH